MRGSLANQDDNLRMTDKGCERRMFGASLFISILVYINTNRPIGQSTNRMD